MRRRRIAINARFATVAVSGVQRYARELVAALVALDAVDAVAIVPPADVIELDRVERLDDLAPSARWSGGRGHLWEQAALPVLFHRVGSDVLLSPCNWGPLSIRRQLPLFHDTAPLFHPEYFVPGYVRWARAATPRLVGRAVRSAVTCTRVGDELVRFAGARPDRIDVVPPGVGAPFVDLPVDPTVRRSPVCVFVGGMDTRKNLRFLTSMWASVHRSLGLELHVVDRGWSSTRRVEGADHGGLPDGVVVHVDLDDSGLAQLLARSLCLLWPSHYEGYGLPLLEAMALGTPFISTDTGAARELAVSPEQVLALDPAAWTERLGRWLEDDPIELRRESMLRARAATWSQSAEALLGAIERCAAA